MQLLCARGLWSCTFIAANSSKLHVINRSNVLIGAQPSKFSQLRALGVRGGMSTGKSFTRGGLGCTADHGGPCMRMDAWGWVRRRQLLRERGGSRLPAGLPKQLRFLSSLTRGGGGNSGQGVSAPAVTKEICLEVSDLRCGSCVAKLEKALHSVDGVVQATVNLATSQARVLTTGDTAQDENIMRHQHIMAATESAGFPSRILWEKARGGGATKVVLDVDGLRCGSCVAKGEEALTSVDGVLEASISLATSTATATISSTAEKVESDGTLAALLAALDSRGYPSTVVRVIDSGTGNGRRATAGEEGRVTPAERYEREVAESRGKVRTSLLLLAVSAVAHMGHHAHHTFSPGAPLTGVLGEIVGSLPHGWFDWLQAGVATAALVGPGSSLVRSGIASMRRLSPDMDSLVSTGVLAVYFSSILALLKPSLGLAAAFHEPVMLLGAVLLGRSLEARQRLKASQGLQGLFDVRPDQARLVSEDGRVGEVPAGIVNVGDTVEVLPSDRFPVDGIIVSGFTAADESSLTGESAPVPKGPGDSVKAGTSSAGDGGAVRVRATATGAQSVLACVIALVEDAQARKAPVQRLVDKIAGKFTWLVFAASASTLVFWGALAPLLLKSSTLVASPVLSEALLRGGVGVASGASWALGARLAVDVCLVACPCSLGLATPTAVMVGTGVAAERGLLLTGADVLETARQATTVVFDKTGTLTTGKPTVTGIVSLNERWTADRILEAAAAVERGCRHPLAEAVVSAAEERLPEKAGLRSDGLRTVPGLGACAQVDLDDFGERKVNIHVGSPKYIEQACPQGGASNSPLQRLLSGSGVATLGGPEETHAHLHDVSQRLSKGETAIVVAVEDDIVGLIYATDTVRPAAAAAVAGLSNLGLKVFVASGDRKEAVWAAAEAAGIARENTSFGATPGDKAALVRLLKERGEVVMVVGDGVNDAPALADADVGVAMRGGTGSAMDAADIVLMQDDIGGVEKAIHVSRLTMGKVRGNLMWALGYNVIALPLAAGVFLPGLGLMLSPAAAGAIMSCSSVAVVTNSLLLRRGLQRELGPTPRQRRT